jgi:hypothetical protein
MKNQLALVAFSAQKINRQHIQFIVTVTALIMFVLGAGAPNDGGGGH